MDAAANNELSPGQLLIWLGMQRHPGAPIYNAVTTFRVATTLDHQEFDAAFCSVVNDSDALRSTFADVAGVPRCIIRAPVEGPFAECVDLTGAPDPDAALDSWVTARSRRILPIETCAFDTALIYVRPGETIWYLNQHHLIADAWSTRLVFDEVARRYAALAAGESEVRGSLPSFGAWIDKVNSDAETAQRKSASEYWERRGDLAADGEPLEFFGTKHESSNPAAERHSVVLDSARADGIRRLLADQSLRALNDDVTLFQIFATALFALLYRASGQPELSIGAPALNRATATERATIGLMMEMLMMRVEVDDADTLETLYMKVRGEAFNFLRNGRAGTSSAKLVRTFSVLLNFVRGSYADFGDVRTDVDYVHTGVAEPHNALRIQVRDFAGHGNFSIDFDFNCDTFSPVLRETLVEQFLCLIDAFVDQRDKRIAELDLLEPDVRSRLLYDLNQTSAEYPVSRPLHGLFEAQVDAARERLAVADEACAIDYGELDRRSNRLAWELIARGVTKGKRVALVLESGVDFVIAALATMKAGGAYMPVDTKAPEARRAALLESGDPAVVITTGTVSVPAGIDTVRLDANRSSISGQPDTRPDVDMDADANAYVLFTSGSTGTPKGVICTHRGVLNLLGDIDARKPLAAGAPCSLWTDIGFDVSVYEIFSALCYGGTLHFVPPLVRPDAGRLYHWCCDKEIESAYLPPFVLGDFVAMSTTGARRLSLRRLLVGVEPIPLRTLQALAGANPGLTIVNGYGPTETTICATLYTVPTEPGRDRRTPIGRPVRNNRAYVLDRFGQPIPHGLPGELYIGGHGVARGYLHNDALTAERFITDPFEPDGGVRLYRTGDRVRYLPDDNLEFIGRIDHQIKLRGHRIEPAEIEKRLAECPDVHEALVIAGNLGDGDRGLVAYLVTDEDLALTASDWYRRLQPLLPSYMIPSAYVCLRGYPQTSSGKIDRKALPAPETHVAAAGFTAPETSLQAKIVEIWCDVLGLERIGIDDHFINIGGDSIQALQIAARAHDAGIRFSARDVFEFATPAALAEQAGKVDDERYGRDKGGSLTDAARRAGISQQDLDELLDQYGEERL
ncbi:MAG: non-ribosomal peptide synthetase [Gammaproteobacteria bacterium]